MELKPENKKKGSGDTHIDPLPCVSTIKAPEISHRVTLAQRSWPFLGSIALHAVLFAILFFPALQLPAVTLSQAPAVLWFTPFIVPGDSGHLAGMLGQPAAAFAQQASAAEPVSDDNSDDAIASELPATQPASTPATVAEADDKPVNADAIIVQPTPKVRSEPGRRRLAPTPAPRQVMPPPAQEASRNPASPSSKPSNEEHQALPAEQPGIIRAEKEQSYREMAEPQDEIDRKSQELAAQKRVLAEIARQEQLVHEREQQAFREQSERERVAAEKIRQDQELQEKLQQERRVLEEQERLTAERTRQSQKVREQEQQALREQAKRKQAAADKARQEQAAREKLQQERRVQEEQERSTAERTRQAQKVREQEQQALREQAKRKQAAADKARQERAVQEQLLRERKLQEELAVRKKPEQSLEQPLRRQLAAAAIIKQQEKPPAKVPENRTEKPSAQQPQKGLILPLVKGDLKLVVTGSTQPNMTITFKEFAPSRRDRPFSRSEARRETAIIPLIATTQENSRELIIEKTNPGVYTITVAPAGDKADVNFSLKLYEGSSRFVTRELGRHTIAGKMVLFKILMPEGVLWADEKAFTGSMEDSNSITRFNAVTGLVWKEFNN